MLVRFHNRRATIAICEQGSITYPIVEDWQVDSVLIVIKDTNDVREAAGHPDVVRIAEMLKCNPHTLREICTAIGKIRKGE
jgi:hypothetical protein